MFPKLQIVLVAPEFAIDGLAKPILLDMMGQVEISKCTKPELLLDILLSAEAHVLVMFTQYSADWEDQIKLIQELFPDLAIILVAIDWDEATQKRLTQSGIDEYMSAPIRIEDLVLAIRKTQLF